MNQPKAPYVTSAFKFINCLVTIATTNSSGTTAKMATAAQYRTRFAPRDWSTANTMMSSTAERQRDTSNDTRQTSQQLRNLTENRTRWTQHDTETKLQERITDINSWKKKLEMTLRDTEVEINALTDSKNRTELAFEVKILPMDVVLECLSLREQRVSIDLVRDEVEAELNKELEVIEGIRVLLSQKVSEGFDQLCVLQDIHQMLHADIVDKLSALEIDTECSELCNTSGTISLQDDPTRIKRGIVNPTTWENFSTYNTLKAQEEMRTSVKLREAMCHTIQQTNNDLETQWRATNYAFRRRIHEMDEAKSELEWQKKNTEDEITAMQTEIEGLSESIAEKMPPMMVAQTRLENRTYRPNMELCRDKPQYNLVDEVGQIRDSRQVLSEKLEVSEQALRTLQRTLQRVNNDIAVKTNSLQLDNQCMKVREKLEQHPKADLLIRGDLSQFIASDSENNKPSEEK